MKKLLSAVLVLVMMFSLASITFAEDNNTNENLQAGPSVHGIVTPEITKVKLILEDGTEVELNKEQIAAYIRITSHEEAEEDMQKVREQNPDKTDEELLNVMCDNGWTFGQNMTLLEMYDVADNAKTTVDFMKAHGDGVTEKAVEFLGLTDEEQAEEKINEYVIAVIFDIKAARDGLAHAAGCSVEDIKALIAEMKTDYVDENSVIFFQRDYVQFEQYRELVNEDKTVNIDVEDVAFFDGEVFESKDGNSVSAILNLEKNGPFVLYVKQMEEAK